jgi:uncharacterized damage-inducible protein DinB
MKDEEKKYQNLEDLFAAKQAALQRLDSLLRSLDDSILRRRPSDGAWSIREIIEHVSLVETSLQQLIHSLLKKAGQPPAQPPQSSPFRISLDFIAAGSARIKTAEKFEPPGLASVSESMATLHEIQSDLAGLKATLMGVDLTAVSFPHWIFGRLNLGQWLAFIVFHEERHLAQIETLLASPEFGRLPRGDRNGGDTR